MANLGNKEIMAKNIKHYMHQNNIRSIDICSALKIPMPTFSDWINAKTYPRIDKIELMANYFGISKADLVEERSSSNIPKIMQYYDQLNDLGKHEATKRVEELTYLPQYADSSIVNAANAIPGASAADRQHDEDIMDDENF